jgi:CHASE2 domain-containing sensor protein
LASVLQYAQAQGAQAIVFDILFSDPDRLHPGGDRAREAAVRASTSFFFTVVRLPPALDATSEVLAGQLPGLVQPGPGGGTGPRVALILPFMKAMLDCRRLGTNTVQVDSDGKIRRFAYTEPLAGGAVLRSIPAAVARCLHGEASDSARGPAFSVTTWLGCAQPHLEAASRRLASTLAQHLVANGNLEFVPAR